MASDIITESIADFGQYRNLAEPSFIAQKNGFKGFFQAPKPVKSLPKMTFEQAFFVILFGSAQADSDIRREEEDQIRLITSRAPTFSTLTNAQVADHQLKASQWIKENNICRIVGAACDVIKGLDEDPYRQGVAYRRTETVFTLAVDIAFVDRSFDAAEQQFINALAVRLNIDDALKQQVIRVMQIKNAF